MRLTRSCAVVAAVVLAVSSTVSCHEPTGRERLLGARAHTPPASSDGNCHFELTSPKDESVFFVLGALDEYLGRTMIEDDDLVERFYCNEHPVAEVFRRRIAALARDQGFDAAMRTESVQGCLIAFRSKVLADRLNSCYRFEASDRNGFIRGPDGQYRRIGRASFDMRLFMRPGAGGTPVDERGLPESIFFRRRALAYLAGAWLRYGHDQDFAFANALEKARLVAGLLSDLGCHGIRIESTVGLVPQANVVHFTATDEVTSWLQRSW